LTALGATNFNDVADKQAFFSYLHSFAIIMVINDVFKKSLNIKEDGKGLFWQSINSECIFETIFFFMILDIDS